MEDHGIVTMMLPVEFEDGGCIGTISGFCFGSCEWAKRADGPDALRSFLAGVFEAVGVHSVRELQGKRAWFLSEKENPWSADSYAGIQGMKDAGHHVFMFEEWRKACNFKDEKS